MKFLLLLSILVTLLQDGYGWRYDCNEDIHCDDCLDNECTYCEDEYGLTQDGLCELCTDVDPNCFTCSNQDRCTSCYPGYGFDEDMHCSLCSDALPNCARCTDLSVCYVCENGYELNSDRTACSIPPCSDTVPHCVDCYDWNPSECNECEEGYEVNSDSTCSLTVPSCSVTPRPIQNYPDLYRGSIIFVDFPFQCGGSVSGVEFYAEHAGTFYFSAWRPSASGDSWMLLGYNTIVSEGEGSQIVQIPSDEQIIVEATDVFGFFYEKGVRYRVISSQNIKKRARDGTSSRFVHKRETLKDLSIGVSRSNLAGNGNTERIVPINAIIS